MASASHLFPCSYCKNFDGHSVGHSDTVWLLYCFDALRAFLIFQKVLVRNGEQKKVKFNFDGYCL